MNDTVLVIKRDGLIHDMVDGEAIVLNIASGTYYSLTGSAADIWNLLGSNVSPDEIADLLERHYRDVPTIREDIDQFLARLVAEGLVHEDTGASGSAPATFAGRDIWQKPELAAFDDLQDLLTIDPIHDVDEGGWPNAKRT